MISDQYHHYKHVDKYSWGPAENYHLEKVHISPEKLKEISRSPGLEQPLGIQRLEVL